MMRKEDIIKRSMAEVQFSPEMQDELLRCSEDFYYFCQFVQVKHPDLGRMEFKPRWYQKEFLDKIIDNRYFVGLLARQVGKTVSVSVYVLWYAMFHSEKTIGIVSNKGTSAKKILAEIKRMYEFLKPHLKPGVQEYNVQSVTFDNNTRIICSNTTEDPFRGETLSLMVCDELGFVKKSIAEAFWSANFPALSASQTSKVIIISTPNGKFNLFERLYSGAEADSNGFVYSRHDWTCIEGRDEKWKEDQIRILGKVKFNQEHGCQFIGSTNTVVDGETLQILLTKSQDPKLKDLNDRLKIFEKPKPNDKYVIGVDTAKGTGEHDSTIQVLKITSYTPFKAKQVAVFKDNYTDIYEFSNIVYRMALLYNKAHILLENNYDGSTVINKLWWDYEYENLVNESQKSTGLGIRATQKTKPIAVLAMKKLIENGDIELVDEETILQLTSFIDLGNNKFTGKDLPDDLVDALYWACYVTEMDVLDEDASVDDNIEEEDGWGILSDVEDDFNIEEEFNIPAYM